MTRHRSQGEIHFAFQRRPDPKACGDALRMTTIGSRDLVSLDLFFELSAISFGDLIDAAPTSLRMR